MSVRSAVPTSDGHPDAGRSDERGSGLLPTVFGLAVVLGLLGFCVNVCLGLWSRTLTEDIAYEALRRVATAPPGADAEAVRSTALERACVELGDRCGEVELRFDPPSAGDDMVSLSLRSPGVRLLPRFLADGGPVLADLDRTLRMHREGP